MSRPDATARGQANLVVLGIALVALTTVAGLGVALADGALAGAHREPLQRHAADALADRLVAPDAATTRRANVLDRDAMDDLSAGDVDRLARAVAESDVAVRLDDRTLVRRGDPAGGVTIRRIVLVAAESTATTRVDLGADGTVALPRRTDRLRLAIRPGPDTRVTTVRSNGRVVLYDPGGLDGTATVDVSRDETVRLSFATERFDGGARGGGPSGTVAVTYYPTRTTKALLRVTVDG